MTVDARSSAIPETPAPLQSQGGNPAPSTLAPPIAVQTLPAPRTVEEIRGIRAQREELSNQLLSAQGRRAAVAKDLAKASDAAAPGLQRRLDVLDTRIAQIETDINNTGRQLTTAAPGLLASSQVADRAFVNGLNSGQVTGISVVFICAVLAPIAFAWARGRIRRQNVQPSPIDRAQQERMERLEQAIDTIALEMERVSEGQRFLTNVLTSGAAQPLGAPAKADAVAVPRSESSRP